MRYLPLLALIACAATPQLPTQPPAPPPPDAVDLVSALSAAGLDHPQGLDWSPGVAAKPGSGVFKNAALLGALPASRVMLGMQSMHGNLGADCEHCHVEHDFASDDKKPKQTARTMMKMALDLDTRFFGGKTYVTCWTCHRGDAQPEAFKPAKKIDWPMPALAEADAQRPAKEVYKNLQVLGDMPAGRLAEAMVAFSSALGTGCVHCHEPNKWAEDAKPAKKRAREMLGMVHSIGESYFTGGKNPVRCGTCHRGSVRPARTAGPMIKVAAALPGGAAAPDTVFVLGPAGFVVKNRGEIRAAVEKDEAGKLVRIHAHQTTEAELGHLAPGAYSLCAMSVPEGKGPNSDPKGAERPVVCGPVTVAPEPEVQTVTRELLPL